MEPAGRFTISYVLEGPPWSRSSSKKSWSQLEGSLCQFVLEGPAGRPLLIIFPFRTSWEALHITCCFRRAGRPLLINFHSVPAGRLCTSPIVLEVPAWRQLLIIFPFSASWEALHINYCFRSASLEAAPHPRFLGTCWEVHYLICFRSASLEAAPHRWGEVGFKFVKS